jgi:hypothetical protein
VSDIKQMAALTALNDMMQKGYVCICTIDKIGEMLGINPKGESHTILRTLHCVHFEKMPQELKQQIPLLIKECLSMEPTFQFSAPQIQTVEAPTEKVEKPRGLLRLLGGKP